MGNNALKDAITAATHALRVPPRVDIHIHEGLGAAERGTYRPRTKIPSRTRRDYIVVLSSAFRSFGAAKHVTRAAVRRLQGTQYRFQRYGFSAPASAIPKRCLPFEYRIILG